MQTSSRVRGGVPRYLIQVVLPVSRKHLVSPSLSQLFGSKSRRARLGKRSFGGLATINADASRQRGDWTEKPEARKLRREKRAEE